MKSSPQKNIFDNEVENKTISTSSSIKELLTAKYTKEQKTEIINNYINHYNFIVFSCSKITTKLINNVEKKELIKMPIGWQKLEKSQIKASDKAFFILTGKISNLTVLDFDNIESYNKLIFKFPELKKLYTVKTGRGYHIYFLYCDKLKSGVDVFSNYNDIDVLNNGKCAVAPPTSYKKLNGETIFYNEISHDDEGDIIHYPEYLLNELILKDNNINEQEIKEAVKEENKTEIKKDETENIKNLLTCLNYNRYKYKYWLNVGIIIFNETNNINIWKEWSKQYKEYDEKEINKTWSTFNINKKKLSIGTLYMYAKEDNNELYNKLFNKKENEFNFNNIITCIDGSFRDIAHLIIEEFKEKFIYSNESYYSFDEYNKLWEEVDENVIKSTITEILLIKINEELKIINESAFSDEKKQIELQKKYVKANKLIGNPDNIKKLCVYLYPFIINKKFQERLNRSHNYLLPVKNNICINLINGESIERTKEHYFNFFIDIEYKPNIQTTNADNFFRSIMNNNEDKFKYLQKILGSFMCSQTEAQSFYIFWGKGSNGKSVLMKLISLVLGPFYATVEKGLFIDQGKTKNSSAASPEKLILKDIRLGVVVETDENAKLAESFLKNLSGDDDITARPLFKSPIVFRPQMSSLILTNNKPTFDINSPAMKRRIKLLNFDASFVENPKKPNEQKINKYFTKKLTAEYLPEVLLFMVLGAIEFNKNTSMTPPQCVQDDINNYIDEIDPTSKFIKTKFQITESPKDKIKRGIIYDLFKNWCSDNGNTIPFKKVDFFKSVDAIIGESKKYNGDYYYVNIKTVDNFDDDEDDEYEKLNTLDKL